MNKFSSRVLQCEFVRTLWLPRGSNYFFFNLTFFLIALVKSEKKNQRRFETGAPCARMTKCTSFRVCMLVNSQIYLYFFLQALNNLSFKYYLSPSVRIYIKEILYPDCSEGFLGLLFNSVLAYIGNFFI